MPPKKNIVYVGGLDATVTEEIVHAAFIPFGEIVSVQIPKDFKENKNKGFAFVEFDLEDDAAEAVDNMDGAELFGKVLRCNIAKTVPKVAMGKAVWSAEEWIKNDLQGQENIDEDYDQDGFEPLPLDPR